MLNKEVDIFVPCCVDQFCPQIGFDMIALIEKLGFSANYNPEQTCCGRLLYERGNWKEAKALGEKFIEDFSGRNIVVGCSTACVGYIKNDFERLFHNTSNHNASKDLSSRVMDICEFIHSQKPDCDLGSSFPFRVYLHQNCHSVNEYNLEEEMKLILGKVKGLELVEQPSCNVCCGMGGELSLYNPAVSEELARQKVERAIKSGADYITSSDAGCLMHMQQYIDRHSLNIKTIHLVSLLMYSSHSNANESVSLGNGQTL